MLRFGLHEDLNECFQKRKNCGLGNQRNGLQAASRDYYSAAVKELTGFFLMIVMKN